VATLTEIQLEIVYVEHSTAEDYIMLDVGPNFMECFVSGMN